MLRLVLFFTLIGNGLVAQQIDKNQRSHLAIYHQIGTHLIPYPSVDLGMEWGEKNGLRMQAELGYVYGSRQERDVEGFVGRYGVLFPQRRNIFAQPLQLRYNTTTDSIVNIYDYLGAQFIVYTRSEKGEDVFDRADGAFIQFAEFNYQIFRFSGFVIMGTEIRFTDQIFFDISGGLGISFQDVHYGLPFDDVVFFNRRNFLKPEGYSAHPDVYMSIKLKYAFR